MEKILGTFRIDSETWNAFKTWANSKNSTASTELNRFILSCLGRIDNLDNCLENNLDTKIDKYLENNLDTRIEYYLEQNLDNRIDIKVKELAEKSLA